MAEIRNDNGLLLGYTNDGDNPAAGAGGAGGVLGELRKTTINKLVQDALDTGDWSALEDYAPTQKELNNALKDSTYKNTKGLSTEQAMQMAQAYAGKYNKYESNSSTKLFEDNGGTNKEGANKEPTAEAAKQLGADSSMNDQITAMNQLLSGYRGIDDGYVRPEYTDVTNADLMSLQDLQNKLGSNVNYDYNAIRGIYDAATKQAYDIEQASGAERSYYKHLADAQNTALDTIRQQYSSAAATGASRGMQAANQLSAIMGITSTANEEATQLAIDKQTRANEYATKMAENAKNALEYSNTTQMDLAGLARQLYNDQIQQQTAQLSYNQGLNTDYANVSAARASALGSLQASLANTAAGVYNNNQSAIASLQAAIENANATKYASEQQRTQYGDTTTKKK